MLTLSHGYRTFPARVWYTATLNLLVFLHAVNEQPAGYGGAGLTGVQQQYQPVYKQEYYCTYFYFEHGEGLVWLVLQ